MNLYNCTLAHKFGTGYCDNIYTLNHKKRDILFLTITLANLNRFLQFLYHFNPEEILHATVVKMYHISLIVCAPYFVNLDNNTFQLKTLLLWSPYGIGRPYIFSSCFLFFLLFFLLAYRIFRTTSRT